jgi:hypothetical protein
MVVCLVPQLCRSCIGFVGVLRPILGARVLLWAIKRSQLRPETACTWLVVVSGLRRCGCSIARAEEGVELGLKRRNERRIDIERGAGGGSGGEVGAQMILQRHVGTWMAVGWVELDHCEWSAVGRRGGDVGMTRGRGGLSSRSSGSSRSILPATQPSLLANLGC